MGLYIYEKVKELSLCDQRRILADLTESVEECEVLDFETWLWLFWEEKLPKLRTQKRNFSLQRKRWKIDLDRSKTWVKLLENSSSFSEYREKFYRFGLFTYDINIEGEVIFSENVLGFDSDNKPLGYDSYYIKGNVLYKQIANGYPLNINSGAVFKSKKKLKKEISKKNEILEVLLKFHNNNVRAVTFEQEFIEGKKIIEYIDELYKIHGEDNLLFVITR